MPRRSAQPAPGQASLFDSAGAGNAFSPPPPTADVVRFIRRFSDPDICRSKHGGNPESEEANESLHGTKEIVRAQVFTYAVQRGFHGITADEVAADWHCSHNHVAPRLSELKKYGLLVPSKDRRKTRAGRWARVLLVNHRLIQSERIARRMTQ